MKTCNKCNIEKELSEFYFRKDTNTHRNECKDCTKAAKALREAKPGVREERARKERERRANDDGTINAKLREYRKTSRHKKVSQEWYKANLDKIRNYNRTQRARRKFALSIEGSASTNEVYTWIQSQDPVCYYCKKILLSNEIQLDHKIPLSRGGTHTTDNFAISCRSCNCSKNTKTPEEFYEYKQKHKQLIEAMDKKP